MVNQKSALNGTVLYICFWTVRMKQISLAAYMSLSLRCSIPNLKLLISASLVSAVFLSGCSPFYVFRAAYEEGKILWRRQPIEELLQDSDLAPEHREKLKLVLAVREYARDTLKFRVKGSYATFSYVDRSALSYVLMVAPKTALYPYTWWFLFVGRVPYKGFFSEGEAKAEAERFEAEGYDAYIRTTPAFSTLGWFDDPLLAHLLEYDNVSLAEIIFHELFHNTLFLKGGLDFNESLANFVGSRAAILFFRERYGEQSPEHARAMQAWKDELEFSAFIAQVAVSLRELYSRDVAIEEKLRLREEIFTRSKQQWARQVAHRPQHRFRGYSQQHINNAVLVNYLLYLKDLDLFDSLYEINGKDLVRTLALIRENVRDGRAPFDAVRELLKEKKAAYQSDVERVQRPLTSANTFVGYRR